MASQMASTSRKLIAILGTTGAGKTKLSIDIAKAVGGEVINADAMQMYEGLDIATAKVTKEECEGVPHHLFSVLKPNETCDIVEYTKMSLRTIEDVFNRGKVPILVGGTMFYTQSILWESQLIDEDVSHVSKKPRIHTEEEAQEAFEKLQKIDPRTAEKLHPNDSRRVLRSLEIFEQTGKTHSALLDEQKNAQSSLVSRFDTCALWVDCDRGVLHDRLNSRVDKMLKQGLQKEIKTLQTSLQISNEDLHRGKSKGILQAIGFKEFAPYFQAMEDCQPEEQIHASLEKCIVDLKSATRQYARRQLTWIRNKFLSRNIPIYQLDTTDVTLWQLNVAEPALNVVEWFLHPDKHTKPTLETANFTAEEIEERKSGEWKKFSCEVCDRVLNGPKEWNVHLKTKKHRRNAALAVRVQTKSRSSPQEERDDSHTISDEAKN